MPDDDLPSLLRCVRAGDHDAAAQVVRRYEPVIRARVRVWLRLNHPRLSSEVDSGDICQSVLSSFFLRAAGGQYDLERPEELAGLLLKMARHKVIDQSKRAHARRRDARRNRPDELGSSRPASADSDPYRLLAGRELLAEVRRRLSHEERRIADLRAAGHAWSEVAAELGGTAEARRKQLARSLDRIATELGIDGGDFGG